MTSEVPRFLMAPPDSARAPGGDEHKSLLRRARELLGFQSSVARGNLDAALAQADPAQSISPHERAMLRNVLTLRRVKVGDVMVPRADIVAVPADIELSALLNVFRTAGHSRLPVFEDSLDNPRGMVHIRDFLELIAANAESAARTPISQKKPLIGRVDFSQKLSSVKIWRPVLFVPGSMKAVELLARMQSSRTHMALVIDEYGGTEGLVSIEDLVEVIVGDIEDEHDEAEGPMIRPESDHIYVADGRATLDEASRVTGVDLLNGEAAEDVDTLAGLIVTLAGRIPVRGEIVPGPGPIEFEILDADPRRVKRVRLHRRTPVRTIDDKTSTLAPDTLASHDKLSSL